MHSRFNSRCSSKNLIRGKHLRDILFKFILVNLSVNLYQLKPIINDTNLNNGRQQQQGRARSESAAIRLNNSINGFAPSPSIIEDGSYLILLPVSNGGGGGEDETPTRDIGDSADPHITPLEATTAAEPGQVIAANYETDLLDLRQRYDGAPTSNWLQLNGDELILIEPQTAIAELFRLQPAGVKTKRSLRSRPKITRRLLKKITPTKVIIGAHVGTWAYRKYQNWTSEVLANSSSRPLTELVTITPLGAKRTSKNATATITTPATSDSSPMDVSSLAANSNSTTADELSWRLISFGSI